MKKSRQFLSPGLVNGLSLGSPLLLFFFNLKIIYLLLHLFNWELFLSLDRTAFVRTAFELYLLLISKNPVEVQSDRMTEWKKPVTMDIEIMSSKERFYLNKEFFIRQTAKSDKIATFRALHWSAKWDSCLLQLLYIARFETRPWQLLPTQSCFEFHESSSIYNVRWKDYNMQIKVV